jgi:hypothetical protein
MSLNTRIITITGLRFSTLVPIMIFPQKMVIYLGGATIMSQRKELLEILKGSSLIIFTVIVRPIGAIGEDSGIV